MVYMIPSRSNPLLDKVDKLSQTAIRHDSNTHLETLWDHSDIYHPEFSFNMKHMGYFSATMNSYMVSLKYDFEEFWSKHWLYRDTFADISNEIPVIPKLYPKLQLFLSKMLGIVKWIIRESKNPENRYPTTKTMVDDLIKPKDACLYIDTMYCNNTLSIQGCVKTFKHHLQNDTLSYNTLHLLMDVYDIQSIVDHNKYYMDESVLNFLMPNVYKLLLNVTIQHVHHCFNNGLSSTFLEFEWDIDNIFDEINAYIPQFTIRSDTPTNREQFSIFGVAFMVVSGLVTAYRIYKSYTFRKNVQQTLSYILDKQRHISSKTS